MEIIEAPDCAAPKAQIYLGDAFEGMADLEDQSIDLAIVDPPYGASTTKPWALPKEHNLSGFGGKWDIAGHDWDLLTGNESFSLTLRFMAEMKRLIRPTGSFWVHATYHNAGFVNVAAQLLDIEIINEVVWFKRNAFPNLSNRRMTASHETIYWLHTGGRKRRYRFNYGVAKDSHFPEDLIKKPGSQLRTVWDIPNNKTRLELEFGKHPTQKPLRLLDRILLVSGIKGGTLLSPFLGSGSDAVAGLRYGMNVIGFELDPQYFQIAQSRVESAPPKQQRLEL